MFDKLKINAVRVYNKGKLTIKKNAPEIWFWSGVGFGIGAIIFAFKNGPKIKEAIESHNEQIDEIHNRMDIPEEVKTPMICKTYIHTVVEVGKAVAVPALLEAASCTCSFMSKNSYKQLWSGAVVLYEGTKAAFDKYRQRNIELNGVEADQKCMYGEGVQIITDDGNGNVEQHTEYLPENMINDGNTFWFDERSGLFVKDAHSNLWQLTKIEEAINQKYKAQGWINRLQIKKALNMYQNGTNTAAEIAADMQIGKIWDKNRTDIENYISFGLDLPVNEAANREKTNVFTITLNLNQNVLKNMSKSKAELDVAY